MRSSIVHVGFAFLAMGSWAVFANRAHPMPAPLYAGLLQAPPLIAGVVSTSLLTAIHMIGGTPEIAGTIAVPLTVATSYAALYNLSLWRGRKAMDHGAG
jgi:hypothetical protein